MDEIWYEDNKKENIQWKDIFSYKYIHTANKYYELCLNHFQYSKWNGRCSTVKDASECLSNECVTMVCNEQWTDHMQSSC